MRHLLNDLLTINLNDTCNLNCRWCYNQGNSDKIMDFTRFVSFYKRVIKDNLSDIVLIGGEPTIHPRFIDILDVLENKKISLFTNGIRFSDTDFCRATHGHINTVTVSVKGFDPESFSCFTNEVGYSQFCQAIENLVKCGVDLHITYNCTQNMTSVMFDKMVAFIRYYKIKEILVHDVRPYITKSGHIIKNNTSIELQSTVEALESRNIHTLVRVNQPFCYYDQQFIKRHIQSKTLMSNCAVKKRQGVFIDSDFNLILCNELKSVKLGQYEVDFSNYKEMMRIYGREETEKLYRNLSNCPMKKCMQCELWELCGGSCILHWI